MVLYIVGLGLGDEKDITVRGLELVRTCKSFYGVEIKVADRDMVESNAEEIYGRALNENIGFLVVGDPLCATTHNDIILRARKEGIKVQVIHNASVMGAVASSGLQLYQFGYTVSIPLFEDEWRPSSFYDRIKYNKAGGMHTLCLLDIKVKEPDYASLVTGKLRYLPPRFMTVNTAIEQLLECEHTKKEGVVLASSLAVGIARLGQATQQIVYGTLQELLAVDFGPPLHSLALCGEVHPLELEMLEYYHVRNIVLATSNNDSNNICI